MSKKAMKLDDKAVAQILSRLPSPPVGDGSALHAWAMQVVRKLAEQPAQQEPVEWMELLREARDNCKASIVEANISASRKEYRIDLEARLTAALNTSPPAQRTWVGLTEEEITTSLPYSVTRDKGCFHAGALWADDKLKDKNNA
jgi:hypothetical protein